MLAAMTVSPLAGLSGLSGFVDSSFFGYPFKFGGFAQGVPALRGLISEGGFSTNFQRPLVVNQYIRCENILTCKNDTDLFYHDAKFGAVRQHATWEKKFDVILFFINSITLLNCKVCERLFTIKSFEVINNLGIFG